MKRVLVGLVSLSLLMLTTVAAKAPATPAYLAVITETPTYHEVIEFEWRGSFKPYEYPYIEIRCESEEYEDRYDDNYPTLFPGTVLFSYYSLDELVPVMECTATLKAAGGNRNHEGYSRVMYGPIPFTAVAP